LALFYLKGNKLNLDTTAAPIPGVIDSIMAAADDIFEPLLTAEEAAEHLRIHVKTLQKLAREQRVPCVRMGKYWRFRLSALDHWVETQQNQFSQPLRVE
jgi:excisionase family DNA binding protein